MDQLKHDPLTKQQIKNGIYQILYDPIKQHFAERLESLIIRNTLLGGYRHKSFTYKGVDYNADIDLPPVRKNRLIPSLEAEMKVYLKEIDEVFKQEVPLVVGFITKVLNSTDNISDYLRLLPDSVQKPIHDLMQTCPCQQTKLSDEAVQKILLQNAQGLKLLKERLTHNLML